MFPFVETGKIYGNVLILIDEQVFWALSVAFVLFMAVGLPWLVNRPMKHSPGLWELSTVDRQVRAQRRRQG